MSGRSPARATSSREAKTLSLPTKPSSGGRPAIDAPAMTAVPNSTGAERPTPDSARMSRVPAWWSTMPTTRNSVALNSAWASSIAIPARAVARVPTLKTTIRKPSWLTVP